MLHGYKLQFMINNIIQIILVHLNCMKPYHEEAVYLGVYSTISVEVQGLSKTLPIHWFAIKSCNKNLK
jgi:hypothetical protein